MITLTFFLDNAGSSDMNVSRLRRMIFLLNGLTKNSTVTCNKTHCVSRLRTLVWPRWVVVRVHFELVRRASGRPRNQLPTFMVLREGWRVTRRDETENRKSADIKVIHLINSFWRRAGHKCKFLTNQISLQIVTWLQNVIGFDIVDMCGL
jgi:hypothetical protein